MTAFQRTNISFHPHVGATVYSGWLSTAHTQRDAVTLQVPRCRVKVQPVNLRVPPPWALALNEDLTASLPQQREGFFTSGGSQKKQGNLERVECAVASCPVVHACLTHPSQLKAALGLLRACLDSRFSGGCRRLGETQMAPPPCSYLNVR